MSIYDAEPIPTQPVRFEDRPLKERVLRNELATIIGWPDERTAAKKADAVLNWIKKHGQHVFVSSAPISPLEAKEMALCESQFLILKADIPYIFRTHRGCGKCEALASVYTAAVMADAALPVGKIPVPHQEGNERGK